MANWACTASTWAICSPRCNICSAPILVCSGDVTVLTQSQAWAALRDVADPEIPVISVCELGIVREVRASPDVVTVVVTPTYSGCPATAVIATSIRDALLLAGAPRVEIETRLSPAWTTDWIAPETAEKLRG